MGGNFTRTSEIDLDIRIHCIPCIHHQPDRQQPNQHYDTFYSCKSSTSTRYCITFQVMT